MRKRILILLCSISIGLCGAACLCRAERQRPIGRVAWWSLLYDRPNPDRLPVQIRFKWVKGLDS